MRILITQHHPDEGPGSLGQFLAEKGAELVYAHAHAGQAIPDDPAGFDAVVSMGGPMNVYEEDKHPWLKAENQLLAKAGAQGLPMIGFCLGAQLIAKAAGAAVVDSPAKEVGWYEARLTGDAAGDPVFGGLDAAFPVVQWHGDMFQIPAGGRLLATGEPCPHQAFAWQRAYGLQFHLEVTPEILRAWFPDQPLRGQVMDRWPQHSPAMQRAANHIYQRLWKLITGA